jgi:hypothetical protein
MVIDDDEDLRKADLRDAASLADLHIRAWQWAYQGLTPDTFLVEWSASPGATHGVIA